MRVVLFQFAPLTPWWGSDQHMVRVGKLLTSRGHIATAVVPLPGLARLVYRLMLRRALEERVAPAFLAGELSPGGYLEGWRQARDAVKRADVIYTRSDSFDLLTLRALLRSIPPARPPAVGVIQTTIWYPRALSALAKAHNLWYGGSGYRWLLGTLSYVQVVHPSDLEALVRRHGLPRQRAFLLPNFVDTQVFSPRPRRPQEGVPEAPLRVLFPSRLMEQKGVDVLADIIRTLDSLRELHRFRFTIAGTGPLEHHVRSLVTVYPERVEWIRGVPDMPQLYNEHDVVIMPSYWEGVPLVLLEALSCGLPAVVSDVPGLGEAITPSCGIICPVGDASRFADALLQMAERKLDPERWATMRSTARERAVTKYSAESFIDALEAKLLAACSGVHSDSAHL